MGKSSFYGGEPFGDPIDQGGQGNSFYEDSPAYTEIDPVAIENFTAQAAASAAAAQSSEDDAEVSEVAANASAIAAASSASAASTSAAAAASSQSAAATSATAAAGSASTATTQASNASASATAAAASATAAATSASNAATSETNAATSATSAASSLTTFKGTWYGSLASNPTLDPNGNAMTAGDVYFNTTSNELRVYNGTSWSALVGGVSSVFGRTGAVTAQSGDYTFAQIGSKPTTLSGYGITDGAPLASPTFTGIPAAPTAAAGTNTTQIATTAFCTTALTPYRVPLTAATTYYVRTDGSDSNNGLTNSAGGAFLTIAKALSVAGALDCGIYQLTISVQAGTYTVTNIDLPNTVGALPPVLKGVGSTTILQSTTAGWLIGANGVTTWRVEDMKLQSSTTTNYLLASSGGSLLKFSGIEFGACVSGYHMWVSGSSILQATGNYSISGSVAVAHLINTGGTMSARFITVTLTGTPNFPSAFWQILNAGNSDTFSTTFSGAATGKRYDASGNGVIWTPGGGPTFFPGSVAGTTATGGQYI